MAKNTDFHLPEPITIDPEKQANTSDPAYEQPSLPGVFDPGSKLVRTNLKPNERGTGRSKPVGV